MEDAEPLTWRQSMMLLAGAFGMLVLAGIGAYTLAVWIVEALS